MTNHPGPSIAQRDNLTVVKCHACGYAHLNTFPTDDELTRFYESDFWQHEKSGELAYTMVQADWLSAIYADWLSIVAQHTRGRELLDVGSGYGLFLKEANVEGWHSLGIEPNTEAAAFSRKNSPCKVLARDWELSHGARFDCISAMWLIEHLPAPLDFLKWCKARLSPDGVLLAVVPQEWTEAQDRANARVDNKNWWVHHTHINYFSQASFVNLLGRAGFRSVDLLASYPMEDFVTNLCTNYIDTPELGRSAHASVRKIELSLTREQRLDEYRTRARYGRGRDLIVVAKAE